MSLRSAEVAGRTDEPVVAEPGRCPDVEALEALDGARRYTDDGDLFLSEGSRAHEELERHLADGGAEVSGIVIECGEGSPTQTRWIRGMAHGAPPEQRMELLRSIGEAPPRAPTRGERDLGQDTVVGDVGRWLIRRDSRRRRPSHRTGHTRARRPGATRRQGSRRGTGTGDSDPDGEQPRAAVGQTRGRRS